MTGFVTRTYMCKELVFGGSEPYSQFLSENNYCSNIRSKYGNGGYDDDGDDDDDYDNNDNNNGNKNENNDDDDDDDDDDNNNRWRWWQNSAQRAMISHEMSVTLFRDAWSQNIPRNIIS